MKVICLIAVMISCCGCEDFLTRNHPTEISDDKFWETMNECENALGQCKLWMKGGQSETELGLMFWRVLQTTCISLLILINV